MSNREHQDRVAELAAKKTSAAAGSASFRRIVRDPRICGGEPTIKGTRIPVRSIVIEYQRNHDLHWVLQGYPRLDADAVKEALAFYEANQAEIDHLIAENNLD